ACSGELAADRERGACIAHVECAAASASAYDREAAIGAGRAAGVLQCGAILEQQIGGIGGGSADAANLPPVRQRADGQRAAADGGDADVIVGCTEQRQ